MNDLSISDINCHMSGIAYNVTGLGIFNAVYCCAHTSVC